MILDAASGAMPLPAIDVDGDGIFTSGDVLSGIQGLGNPLAAPTVVSAGSEDVLLTNNIDGSGAINTTLDAGNQHGRISWRELEP